MRTIQTNMPIHQEYDVAQEVFEVSKDAKGMSFEITRAGSGATVATLAHGLRPEEKSLAVLFATAPQMLDLLERIIDTVHIKDSDLVDRINDILECNDR